MTEETLFELARKTPELERKDLLDRACEGKPELRTRVEALLRADAASSSFLKQQVDLTQGYQTKTASMEIDQTGKVIAGKYKLLEEIGEGGMGTVFVAEQTEPVKRKVAVKLIKPGMDSRNVLARFEAERQALAMMDHPNIARVLDAGLTEERRPYFVMEYIKGLPLTKYCDDVKLSIDERLKLFIQICQAVQHAHQKGIIHRDLKPSNILIALYDGKPVPKVIDFGLAKALHQSLTERTLHTGHEVVLGTPLYMSPEQAELNNLDIDTRSDIYSLGVILYELLTGVTPLEKQRFKEAAWAEVLRIIKEEEPSKPSTKLSLSNSLPTVAAQRQMEPKKLSTLMKGELDWIVMKALEKDRTRRYETANGFACDIQRYLSDEVVEARPPSTGYRLRKFVRRNKGKFIAASLVLATLLIGIMGTTSGMLWAFAAEKQAVDAATAERQAKQEAEQRRAESEKRLVQIDKGVNLFAGLLKGLNPANEGEEGTLYEQLQSRAILLANELQGDSIGDPVVVARLQAILGKTLMELACYAKSVEVLERARATLEKELGEDHLDTLTTLKDLAFALMMTGDTAEEFKLYQQLHARRARKLGIDHPDTLSVLHNLTVNSKDNDRLRQAIRLWENAIDLRTKKLGPNHSETLSLMDDYASALGADSNYEMAISLFERIYQLQSQHLGEDHRDTMTAQAKLARTHRSARKYAEAIKNYEKLRDKRTKKLGADHEDTLSTIRDLAETYQDAQRHAEAIALYEQLRDRNKKVQGADHEDTLSTLSNLARAYQVAGQHAEAIRIYEQLRHTQLKKLGADHEDTLRTHSSLGEAFQAAGRLTEAITIFEQLCDTRLRKLGADHMETIHAQESLALAYRDAGKLQESLQVFEQAARAIEKQMYKLEGEGLARHFISKTIRAYEDAKQFKQAEVWRRKMLTYTKDKGGEEHNSYCFQLTELGRNLLHQHKWTPAEMAFRDSLAILEKKQLDTWWNSDTLSMLGNSLLSQKKYAEAEPLLLKGYEGMKVREKTIPPERMIRLPEALDRLIQLYTETNKPNELKKWQAEKDKLSQPDKKK